MQPVRYLVALSAIAALGLSGAHAQRRSHGHFDTPPHGRQPCTVTIERATPSKTAHGHLPDWAPKSRATPMPLPDPGRGHAPPWPSRPRGGC